MCKGMVVQEIDSKPGQITSLTLIQVLADIIGDDFLILHQVCFQKDLINAFL